MTVLFHAHSRGKSIRSEFDSFNPGAFHDLRTLRSRVAQEQLVKATAIHVIGVGLGEAQLGHLPEADLVLPLRRPMRPNCAMLVNKTFPLHLRKKVYLLKNSRGGTYQRFTDVRPRMNRLIEN